MKIMIEAYAPPELRAVAKMFNEVADIRESLQAKTGPAFLNPEPVDESHLNASTPQPESEKQPVNPDTEPPVKDDTMIRGANAKAAVDAMLDAGTRDDEIYARLPAKWRQIIDDKLPLIEAEKKVEETVEQDGDIQSEQESTEASEPEVTTNDLKLLSEQIANGFEGEKQYTALGRIKNVLIGAGALNDDKKPKISLVPEDKIISVRDKFLEIQQEMAGGE